MKHIKPYKIFESVGLNFPTTREEVIEVCEKHKIINYTINDDLSIDVDGGVGLSDKGLKYLPLRFNYVSGLFQCSFNGLLSLEGSPQTVGKHFDCSDNKKLKSLKGGPQTVGGYFNCGGNNLKTLEGCPQTVSDSFYCHYNKLTSLESCPQKVGGSFGCFYNNLESLEGCPHTVDGSFLCSNNELKTLKGSPQTVGGSFYCADNELRDLEHFPEVSGSINIEGNTVYLLVHTFIENANSFLIEDFIDYEIVRNGDTVMLDRLQTFIRDNDLEMPDLDEIKKHYKIIE